MSNEFFRPVARFVATSGITAHAFAFLAGAGPTIERMLRSTGSKLDAGGTRYYQRLASNPAHVAGALGLMANWDLQPLLRDMPRLDARLILVTGSKDGMVPPAEAFRVRALLPKAELVSLRGLGHLAHEEKPGDVAEILKKLLPRES
jgi:magnesium chelatase accessory protein